MSEGITHTTIAQELASGNAVTYFTVGVSMRPLLTSRRTHVQIAPLTQPVQKGDILLYRRQNGALVLHRCIRQDGEYYYMRGDNTYGLEPIAKHQALGVVTHIYRRGRLFGVRESVGYRCYAAVWTLLYPLRLGLHLLRERVCRLLRAV